MKVIQVMFLLSVFCLSTQLMAQGPGEGRQGRRGQGMNMDTLKVKLSLSDDQVTEFETINEEMRTKRKEIFESSNGDREAMRESMMELRADAEQQIKDILTVEQWGKYEAFQAEMREKRRARPEGGERPRRKKKKVKDTDTN